MFLVGGTEVLVFVPIEISIMSIFVSEKKVTMISQHTGTKKIKEIMFGLFSKKRREEKTRLKELGEFTRNFTSLEKLEKSGMLAFDVKSRRLFIEQPLVIIMMKDAESWQNFIMNVFHWLYYRQCQEAWDRFFQTEELKAVREATKKYAMMTRADIERVKRSRREEIAVSDVNAPKVLPFEFFVIKEVQAGAQHTGESVPGGKIIAVGSFNPETGVLEMATWEEVSKFFAS